MRGRETGGERQREDRGREDRTKLGGKKPSKINMHNRQYPI